MEDTPLPIRPTSPSLISQIRALDLLSARLENLSSKSLPVRVPLTTKASFRGVVQGDLVKVNLGAGWWIDMTPHEASDYLQRRRSALLEDQARRIDGSSAPARLSRQKSPKGVTFNPIFAPLGMVEPSIAPASSVMSQYPEAGPSKPSPRATPTPPKRASASPSPRPSPITNRDSEERIQTLTDLVNGFVEKQQMMAKGRTISHTIDETVNDEGLPIREIKEDLSGRSLDPLPEATVEEEEAAVQEAQADDYWSSTAVERRAALRRSVFHEDSDSDSSLDIPAPTPPRRSTSPPIIRTESPSPYTPNFSPPDTPISTTPRRPSAELPPPSKSILKRSMRKKSVSFDSSLPSPPTSPDDKPKSFFPMPAIEIKEDIQAKKVPLLNAPVPGRKSSSETTTATVNGNTSDASKMFSGFKKGFLSTPSPPSTGPVSPISPTTTATPAVEANSKPKKTSLFAQRRAEGSSTKSDPPKSQGDESRPVKAAVVERPIGTYPPKPRQEDLVYSDDDEEEDDDDDDDEVNGESSYNIDEALLAREMALDAHRRTGFEPISHQDEEDYEGVFLSVPTVQGDNPRIVNPSPSDLRKAVRVGKLENGNFVLAPGEKGWSDDEVDDTGKRNVDEMKKKLLNGDYGAKEEIMELPPRVQSEEIEVAMPKKVSRFKASRMNA